MNKMITFILICMLVLTAACKTETKTTQENMMEAEDGDHMMEDMDEHMDSSPFTNLKSVMMSGAPYECVVTTDQGVMKTIIKGEKFKSEATVDGRKMNTIMDKMYMYSWVNGENEGIKYNLKQMEEMRDQYKTYPGAEKQQTVDVEKNYDMDCHATTAADSLFVPPSNVKFTDMSEMMKQMQEQMSNLNNLPNVEYN